MTQLREEIARLKTELAERTAELNETKRLLEIEIEKNKSLEDEFCDCAPVIKLQQSDARFRAIFENAGIGIGLIGLDRYPIEVNAAFLETTGYTADELSQIRGADLSYPEDADLGMPEMKDVLDGKRGSFKIEKRFVRKNGEVYWVRLTNSVVRTPDGKPQYMVAMLEDIDAQRKSADELHKSQARFQAVFENAAVGIAVMTLDLKMVQVNQTVLRLTGYRADEMEGSNPSVLMSVEEDRNIGLGLYRELVQGKRKQYTIEKRFIRKDGEIFWGRVNSSAVHDANGQPLYTVALIEDITAEKRAAERLSAQEAEYRQMLEQRIAERTDELNKANELLQQKAAQEAVTTERTRLARDLHDAVTQTLFSASLIAEVLPDIWDLNQAEGRKRLAELRQLTRGALAEMRTLLVELRPNALVEIPLPDLLRQLCESLIGRARLPIQLDVEGQRRLSPDVQIGLYRITQEALNNVVKHAKATQVVVTLRLDETVRLSIADNGCGFDPAAVPPDHLGLKIMRERAEAIGAAISIYGEPGEGTQISVSWS